MRSSGSGADVSIARAPIPTLRGLVSLVWANASTPGNSDAGSLSHERVLPTGATHLVFRLGDEPLRLLDEPSLAVSTTLGHAIVGGPRAGAYVKNGASVGGSVGAVLVPGASRRLFGVPADELAERHVRLEDLWGNEAGIARARLAEEGCLARRLELFEAMLLAKVATSSTRARGAHPVVARALACWTKQPEAPVSALVTASGYSHRGFAALFRRDVGLGPKTFARIARFQRALAEVVRTARGADAMLAASVGYADQAHFSREFREISGVTPAEYRTLAPTSPNHVPLEPRRGQISSSDRARSRAPSASQATPKERAPR